MYYYLNGILELNEAGTAVIDCSGVAYKLTTSLITSDLLSDKVGQKVKLYTHLAVREDGIELFGFESTTGSVGSLQSSFDSVSSCTIHYFFPCLSGKSG